MTIRSVFHGTTAARAAAIVEAGFHSFDPADHIASVALEYGLDTEELASRASELFALTTTQEGRGNFACFAQTVSSAWSWASRAPETRWELLRAVWALQGGDPWDNDSFVGWRRLQYHDHIPAVVVVEAPDTVILGRGGAKDLDFELFDGIELEYPELWIATPVPHRWVIQVEHGPRRVFEAELASLMGVPMAAVRDATAEGRLPQHHLDERSGRWWTWDDLVTSGHLTK